MYRVQQVVYTMIVLITRRCDLAKRFISCSTTNLRKTTEMTEPLEKDMIIYIYYTILMFRFGIFSKKG